ncbi:putative DNA-binding protein SMUBP-2-like isoform X1 [Penaeus vannamei]|uniref:Putative DNA-binding protein SMUBP-2-like isoform X1 n=1 Tax=Penaeus vannamei TaxID=6689 RepID=A0A423U0V3_PENVA|nr:putative DNA-binding protein SMUBP-2-like isoform X1 [Penaeus vannamei]
MHHTCSSSLERSLVLGPPMHLCSSFFHPSSALSRTLPWFFTPYNPFLLNLSCTLLVHTLFLPFPGRSLVLALLAHPCSSLFQNGPWFLPSLLASPLFLPFPERSLVLALLFTLVPPSSRTVTLVPPFQNTKSPLPERSLVLVDTAGCDCQELDTAEEQSKGNEGEAIIVSHYVRALLEAGLPEEDVAVITPYNLQVELVRGLLREDHPRVEVRSVDGFQGREKEAVVMSLVRSNKQGTVGFLSENRRLNVAVTRARRHLAVVCDSETVGTDPFLKGFLDYMVKHALVRTAFEFQHEMETTEVATPECISMRPKDEKKDKKSDSKNKKPNNRKDGKEGPKRKKGDSKPKYKPPTEEENQERRQKLEAIIKDFVSSASNVYQFPPGLNSFERRLVHEICDAEGLFHQSQGEGSERYLVVQKEKTGEGAEARNKDKEEEEKEKKDEEKEENDKEKEVLPVQVEEGEEEDERIEDEDEEEGQGEDKKREEENEVSEFAEEREEKESPTADGGAIPKLKNLNLTDSKPRIAFINGMYQEVSREHNNTKADKTGDKMGKENETSAARCQSCGKDILQQNFSVHSAQCERKMRAKKEEMERRKEDNTCSQPKCKTPTTVIFQQCPFCRKTFCLTHHMAEMVIREGVIYPGSGIPSKKPKDAKRKQLQRNLDKKLGDLTSQRQSKKPGKDKDKGKGTK